MIKNVENLHAELNVEILGDSADVIVFEDREIETGHTGAGQNIASGIAAEIVALKGGRIDRAAEARWSGTAVGIPKGSVRSCRDGEALCFNVIARVSGIG